MPWKYNEEGQWIEVGDDGNPVGGYPLRPQARDPKDTGFWPSTILRGNDPLSRLVVPSFDIPKPKAEEILAAIKQRFGGAVNKEGTANILAAIRAKLAEGKDQADIVKEFASNPIAAAKLGEEYVALGKEAAADGKDKQYAQGGIVVRPDGTIMNTQTGIKVDADGNWSRIADQDPPKRDSAAIGADTASAFNSYAQAARSAAMTTIDVNNAAKAGTQDGLGPGYTWKSDGSFSLDGNLTSRDKEDIERVKEDLKLRREIFKDESANRANLLKNDTARLANDTTRTGYEGQRVGIEGQRAAADERYQQGQLQQGQSRLDMDRDAAASEAAFKSNQSALARDEYTSKVLSSPADFIARAFNQRGETSPSKPITQADLINTVNQQYQQAPTQFVAPRLPTYAMGTTAPTLPTNPSRLDGYVRDKMAVVGDPQADGMPNPEVISNPTGAPISVTPMRDLQGGQMPRAFAEGTPKPAPSFHEKTADGIAKLLQHVQDPQTMHRLVDELSEHRGRLSTEGSQSQQSMPHYAGGTLDRRDVMGMELPTGGGGPIGGGSGRSVTKPSPTTTPLEQAQLINELRGTMDIPQDNARGNRPENRLVNYLESLFQSANGMSYSDYARTQHPNGVPYNPNTPGWSSLPKGWEAVIDSAKGLMGYSYGTSRLELPHYAGGTQDRNNVMGMELPTGGGGPVGGGSSRGWLAEPNGRTAVVRDSAEPPKRAPSIYELENKSGLGAIRDRLDPSDTNEDGSPSYAKPVYSAKEAKVWLNENLPATKDMLNKLGGDGRAAVNDLLTNWTKLADIEMNKLGPTLSGTGKGSGNPEKLQGLLDGINHIKTAIMPMLGYAYGTSRLGLPHYATGTEPVTTWQNPSDSIKYAGMTPTQAADYAYKEPGYNYTPNSQQKEAMMPYRVQDMTYTNPVGYKGPPNPWGSAVRVTPGKTLADFARRYPKYNNLGGGGVGTADYLNWLGEPSQEGDSNYVAPIVPKTQAEIIAKAETNLPPAIKQLFGGRLDPAFDTTTNVTNNPQSTGINPLRMGFNLFTPQALGQLTLAEKQALNSYLAAKYNTTLEDVLTGMQQSFGQGNNGMGNRMRVGRLG